MVWNEGIAGDQPVGHFAVEFGEVGKQEVFVVVDEAFLDGAVEAFGMGVHLGGAGVGPPVSDAILFEFGIELAHELGAIVGEPKAHGVGQE